MSTTNDHLFYTSDTALAAYIVSEGLPYPSIQHTLSKECVFCFSVNGDKDIYAKLERDYRLGIALGNIVAFYRSYKQLLRQVH